MRVGILGSCVTRDLFKGMNHPALSFYVARTSILSIFKSGPDIKEFNPFPDSIPGLTNFEFRQLRNDFTKANKSILASPTDVLIFDAIDQRFRVLHGFGGTVTKSRALTVWPAFNEMRGLMKAGLNDPSKNKKDWVRAIKRLKETIDISARIIIHRALWAPCPTVSEVDRSAANARLNRIYDAVENGLGNTVSITVPEEYRVAEENHRWGPAPFHYTETHNEYVRDEIRRLAGTDIFQT
jgi:hypothetical protein